MFRSLVGKRVNLNQARWPCLVSSGQGSVPERLVLSTLRHQVFATFAKMERWYFEQGKDLTFDVVGVREDRASGTLELKLSEMPLEDFK